MFIDKVLVFDLKGDYAHFKKYYTTTSPLTFSIPPKTVMYGIIGAILGLSKEKADNNYYLKYFQELSCKIGIKVINSIRKTRISLNLIDTKTAVMMSRIKNRTQIRTEYVINPYYRIYFYHDNQELYHNLKDKLQKHHSYYSISLGLSENLANYQYQGESKVEIKVDNDEFLQIDSVILLDQINIKKGDIDFSKNGREYFTEKVALEMKENREVINYGQLLYERNGKTIYAKPSQYYKLENGENIILM
ncbi:MAG: type I-B CRISPR-associated protein Cas5b [Halanaerobiales bacterium]|nr:type I-B CRISPR-associated protein Cas5b [Halanaerobiales bacterium]